MNSQEGRNAKVQALFFDQGLQGSGGAKRRQGAPLPLPSANKTELAPPPTPTPYSAAASARPGSHALYRVPPPPPPQAAPAPLAVQASSSSSSASAAHLMADGGGLGGGSASVDGGGGGSADGGGGGGGGGGEGEGSGDGGLGDVNWSDDDALDAMVDDIGREVDGKSVALDSGGGWRLEEASRSCLISTYHFVFVSSRVSPRPSPPCTVLYSFLAPRCLVCVHPPAHTPTHTPRVDVSAPQRPRRGPSRT